jgi:phytoene dehydrogenase-like protein
MFEDLHPYVNDVFGLFQCDLPTPATSAVMARLMGDPTFAAAMFSTARHVVSPFQSPVMRAMLASWVTHLGRTPDEIGSGLWVPLTAMALMGGGMPTPEGGSERLAQALAQLVVDQGGVIHTHTLVQHIIVANGRAVGVRTADGYTFRAAQAVVACTTPDQLYLSLLADTAIDPPLRTQAAQFRYGRGCVQMHLALSEPPRWPDARFHTVGQPHLTNGLDGCTLAVAQGMADLVPVKPTFTVDCSTNLDPTRAPAGKAIMRVQVLEVPIRPRGDAAGQIDVGDGTWTHDLTERFTERVLDIVSKHRRFPRSKILQQSGMRPRSFYPENGLTCDGKVDRFILLSG